MGTSSKGKVLLVLFGCVFILFGFSFFGVKAYGALFNEKTVPEGVVAGGIVLSGLTQAEAEEKLNQAIAGWKENSFYFLQTDRELGLDSNLVTFDVKKTAELALENKTNKLIAAVDAEALRVFLENELSPDILPAVDQKALASEMELAASELTEGIFTLSIENYLVKEKLPKTLLAGSVIPASSVLLQQPIAISIEPLGTFSLETYMEENSLQLDDDNLSLLATGIYQTVLLTNFEILERHISVELPAYAELGKEAVFAKGKRDLVFYNPNDAAYELKLAQDGTSLNVSIEGAAFENTYSLTMENEKSYKPKKILQYDAALNDNTTRVIEEGRNGQSAAVYRNELDQNGKLLSSTLISDDYYAPVHRVEVKPLKKKQQVSAPAAPGEGVQQGEEPDQNEAQASTDNPSSENQPENSPQTDRDQELWEEPAFEKGDE
ncbi:G5 domain-containing protein [Metabacillus indicus]|uniref:G5 domain-containing protein n=1 Tax=Metabacillus indicus TaxID=246786 RepID=UPI002A05630C|nr:G5 domain-containing protein [Metabacillus indicus]MDX8290010.1 G5 domain-containing protein [Metabacillus indicus]